MRPRLEAGLVAIAVLALIGALRWPPRWRAAARHAAQVQALTHEAAELAGSLCARKGKSPGAAQTLADLTRRVQALTARACPERDDPNTDLEPLVELVQSAGLSIADLTPEPQSQAEAPCWRRHVVRLELTGGYARFRALLAALSGAPRLYRVEAMKLESVRGDELKGDLRIARFTRED